MTTPTTPEIGLAPRDFSALFPFHFVVGEDLCVRQVGEALSRVLPGLCPGEPIANHLLVRRPQLTTSYEELVHNAHCMFLLQAVAVPKLVLKGQIYCLMQEPLVAFVGSPWVTEVGVLKTLGISLRDFAIFDPVADYLFLLQTQRTAIADANRLAEELRQLNAVLEDRVRERTRQLAELQAELARDRQEFQRTIDAAKRPDR
ncbi:MAG: hypothetical protein IT371_10070 [Deltaproteobacteria bacterium]|nr:hypothetical protein [Deltaproteobacteria bacterium]